MINTIGPVWDANEVWLLVAGGATFAAFPEWYATLFSGFYLPLLLILLALIARGVAFEFRGKREEPAWRRRWDVAIVVGSAVPALLWGVAFGSILHGVPIDATGEYVGGLLDLLHPYALLGGVVTLLLFTLHGAVFLTLKTRGELTDRARALAVRLSLPTAAAVLAFLAWSYVNAQARTPGVVPPLVPVLAVGASLVVAFLLLERMDGWAFAATGAVILLLFTTVFANLYPRVLVSSIDAAYDLTIGNASSTPYTLRIMTGVAIALLPFVLGYQAWSYWVFRRRIGREDLGAPPAEAGRPKVGG
jgi:cytochrome bd ubiquinol oxidase subunit II